MFTIPYFIFVTFYQEGKSHTVRSGYIRLGLDVGVHTMIQGTVGLKAAGFVSPAS